ncbi:insulinase family protein [Halomonas sp. WWR20]
MDAYEAIDGACFPELPSDSRVATQRLDNGLALLAIEVPTARQVRLAVAVGVGYLDEPDALPGLAHLLEHALFLGSRIAPRPGEFAAWIGDMGGRYNARTDEDTTDFHLTLPPTAAEAGLTRLMELLLHPCLDTAAIGREVDVLDAEFHARLGDPALHRQAVLSRFCVESHPAHACHAGNRASLGDDAAPLREQLVAFHRAHYRAERMSLVMLGPAPLSEQLALLQAAGAAVPTGAQPLPPREWRWKPAASLAHLQWCLPETLPARAPTLELLWPLPHALAEASRGRVDRLKAALCDGSLAKTLQHEGRITDLIVSLTVDATGTALSLALVMTESGTRQVGVLLATCQAAIRQKLRHIEGSRAALPSCPSSPFIFPRAVVGQDIEHWPVMQARRLARGLPLCGRNAPTGDVEEKSFQGQHKKIEQSGVELRTWLAPSACRVVEEVATFDDIADSPHWSAVQHVPQTLTRFREYRDETWRQETDKPLAQSLGLTLCTPPSLLRQPRMADTRPVAPGRLEAAPFALWWGAGPRQQGGSWCVGWPAPPQRQPARLAIWQRRTLALRQAAQAQGVLMTLGGDVLGDWLIARGRPGYLTSAVMQALTAWPKALPSEPLSAEGGREPLSPPPGLLAQRLLARLESPSLRQQQTQDKPEALGWAAGEFSAGEARAGGRCLASRLASFTKGMTNSRTWKSQPPSEQTAWHWLDPEAEDYALMLQVEALDASPTSRLLMQLLAWCHDAAFFTELRQRRALGYIAAVRYREAQGWPRLGYVVQSPHADIEQLQQAITHFIHEQAVKSARLDAATLARRRDSLRAAWGAPETLDAAILAYWQALRSATFDISRQSVAFPQTFDFNNAPWAEMARAQESFTAASLTAHAEALVSGGLPWQWWAHAPARHIRKKPIMRT